MSVRITISDTLYNLLKEMADKFRPVASENATQMLWICSREQAFELGEEYGRNFLADAILSSGKARAVP